MEEARHNASMLDSFESKLRSLYTIFMEFTKGQPKRGQFPIDSSVTETFCAVELCDAISLSLIQVKSLKSDDGLPGRLSNWHHN